MVSPWWIPCLKVVVVVGWRVCVFSAPELWSKMRLLATFQDILEPHHGWVDVAFRRDDHQPHLSIVDAWHRVQALVWCALKVVMVTEEIRLQALIELGSVYYQFRSVGLF
jgi:hypothetical protein